MLGGPGRAILGRAGRGGRQVPKPKPQAPEPKAEGLTQAAGPHLPTQSPLGQLQKVWEQGGPAGGVQRGAHALRVVAQARGTLACILRVPPFPRGPCLSLARAPAASTPDSTHRSTQLRDRVPRGSKHALEGPGAQATEGPQAVK